MAKEIYKMDKKLFFKSTLMSASILFTLLIVINIPSVLAETPPYYKGPFKGYMTDTYFIEVAQIGLYDYENPPVAPYPCVLHQAYGYAIDPWELYGNINMTVAAWDQSQTLLYGYGGYGSPGYAYYYGWPESPYAYSEYTLARQYYWNTQTQQVEMPPPAEIGITG